MKAQKLIKTRNPQISLLFSFFGRKINYHLELIKKCRKTNYHFFKTTNTSQNSLIFLNIFVSENNEKKLETF